MSRVVRCDSIASEVSYDDTAVVVTRAIRRRQASASGRGSPLARLESEFALTPGGVFRHRDGRGRSPGVTCSQQKLCFVSTDKALLAEILLRLSRRRDCYYVKYSAKPTAGMYLGRCFLLSDEAVGRLWARYKRHPAILCSVQDDNFTKDYR